MRPLLATSLAFAGAVALAIAARASAPSRAPAIPTPFVNGPYLQNLGAHGVEVRVELDGPAALTLDVVDEAGKRHSASDAASTFHVLRVDGLEPETAYHYVVRAGAFTSHDGHFVTAPPDGSRAPFSFVLYGDSRSNAEAHAVVVRAIARQSFDFLVNTGDFVAAGGELPLWRTFFAIEADLLREHCVFACVGNHELVDDQAATNYMTYFGARPSAEAGAVTVPYRSFRWESARFFLLNAFQDWGGGELSWLQRELDEADAEPGVTTRVVVVHRSPWSSGHHGDDTKMIAAGVPELLVRHHVDLVLAGHDHIYERGEWKGLKYVISGGAGAPLYTDITPRPSTRRAEATYNFVRFAVDPDAIHMEARRPDGSLIEACGFAHGASWDCDGDGGKPVAPTSPPSPGQAASRPTDEDTARAQPSSRCGCELPGVVPPSSLASVALALASLVAARRRRRGRARDDGHPDP